MIAKASLIDQDLLRTLFKLCGRLFRIFVDGMIFTELKKNLFYQLE